MPCSASLALCGEKSSFEYKRISAAWATGIDKDVRGDAQEGENRANLTDKS